MRHRHRVFPPFIFRMAVIPGLLMVSATAFAERAPQERAASRPEVERLVAAARRLDTAWPWQGLVPEAAQVIQHGKAVAPELVALLRYEGGETREWDLHVEQQVELILCRLFEVPAESGKTVYGIRSRESENARVKRFWEARVRQYLATGH